ncbi:hypothetical protein DPSP01_008680 [Paraphaeosphaeria sporulosa]
MLQYSGLSSSNPDTSNGRPEFDVHTIKLYSSAVDAQPPTVIQVSNKLHTLFPADFAPHLKGTRRPYSPVRAWQAGCHIKQHMPTWRRLSHGLSQKHFPQCSHMPPIKLVTPGQKAILSPNCTFAIVPF